MSSSFDRFRIPVVLVAGAALLALAGSSFARRVGDRRPLVGVEWTQASAGPVAVSVDPVSAAAAAGLRIGDVLLEVEGHPVSSALVAGELAWQPDPSTPIEVTVSRGGTRQAFSIAPRWGPRTEPYVYLFVVGVAFGLSGALISARWLGVRGGPIYGLFAASMFLHLTLSPTGAADGFDWVIEWIDRLAGLAAPVLLFHVAVALTKRTLRRKRAALAVAYGVAVIQLLAWLWLAPTATAVVYRLTDPRRAIELLDRFGYLALFVSVVATSLVLSKSYTASSSTMHRGQMRWLLWGLTIGLGPFLILDALPWILGLPSAPHWAQLVGVLPMLFVPAAFTAAMARYRLYDVDLLLLRGLREVAAVLATAAVYAAVTFVLRVGISELIPMPGSFIRYLGILVAAVAYPQVRLTVKAGVERAFYRQRYSYRATLLDWARELNAETDLPSLLGRLRERVRDTLGVRQADVLVSAGPWRFEAIGSPALAGHLELDESSLERLDQTACVVLKEGALPDLPWARYLFPMKVKGALGAILAISNRADNDQPITSEDRSLLVTLAAQAGTAIEAARLVLEVRRRAEEIERLHAQQARIFESSAVGLLLLERHGNILAWNRALEAIYGLPHQEAVGRALGEVFPLHAAHRVERELARAAPFEEARIFRLSMINRAAKRVVVNITIGCAEERETRAGGLYVVTLDDVTARARLEEQVLQQERLASLGLLAAGVAHEINTPLTGVSSYAQLLLEDLPENDPRREVLRKIEAQTGRASRIANSLLTLARPERTVFEETDVNEAAREALQLFEPQVRGRDIRLSARLESALPVVLGHRGKLQQVLLNLLLNARDAVGEGGDIQVVSWRDLESVVVEVADDGAGIAEEDLPRIFDPFFTTKPGAQGTGLGLSVSYGIVREHNGRIEAESVPNGLTRFRVTLPTAGSARAAAR